MQRLQPYVYEGNEFSQDFAAITTVKVGAFNCSANVAPAHLDLKDGGVPFYHLEDRTVAIHDQRFSPCNLHLQLIYDSDQQQQHQHDHRDQGRGGGGASAAGTAGAGAGVDPGSRGGGGGSAGVGDDAGVATFATAVVVGATACVTFHCIPTTEAAAAALSAATTDPGVQTVAELMQALKRGATGSSAGAGAAGDGAADDGNGGDSGDGADGGVHNAFLSVHAHLSKFIHAAAACT